LTESEKRFKMARATGGMHMHTWRIALAAIIVGWLGPAARVHAQLAGDPAPREAGAARGFDDLLFRQPPDQYNGVPSDTAWTRNPTGQLASTLGADNFTTINDVSICGIIYYGFYGANAPEPPPYIVDPPATETMRIQFYSDAGGLPASVLWERTFDDARRVATGRDVAVSPNRPEYQYIKGFADCFQVQAGVQYWISISQIGDAGSRWRWESAHSDNSRAEQSPTGGPWRIFTSYGFAFDLYRTPEPSSAVLLILAGLARRRPPARRARR
jgi:hypothetical protein